VDITNHHALVYKQDEDVGEEDMPNRVANTGNLAKTWTGVFLTTFNGGHYSIEHGLGMVDLAKLSGFT
jgi:hypothetical protein